MQQWIKIKSFSPKVDLRIKKSDVLSLPCNISGMWANKTSNLSRQS